MMKFESKDVKIAVINYLQVFKEKNQYNEELSRKYFRRIKGSSRGTKFNI